MKKYLVWIGAAVLVVALASPAAAQFKSWGHIEIATGMVSKQDFNVGTHVTTGGSTGINRDLTLKEIAQRYRFYLQYGDPKTVRAVLGFEADSRNWGEAAWSKTSDTTDANYSASANPSGRMGVFGADQVQLELKHAYLDFVIPNTPLSVTAGIQFYGIGGRMFQSKDIPGLTVTAGFAPHKVMAYWWRERDVTGTAYNVNDSYGLQYQLAQKQFNVYAYGFYKNDLTSAAYDDHPWWIGVGGGFKPAPFDISAQFIYLGGKRDGKGGNPSYDFSGWAAELLAQYRIGPGLAVALEGYYSTGNDADDTTKFKRYAFPAASEVQWGFGNGRSVFFFYNADFMYYWGKALDFTGLWYARANVEYNPLPWINLNFNYLFIGDTSTGTGGTGRIVNSPAGSRQDVDKSNVGQEVNVIAKFKIYDPLFYNIGFGYFLPGDVYDSTTKGADAAWAFLTKLIYAF